MRSCSLFISALLMGSVFSLIFDIVFLVRYGVCCIISFIANVCIIIRIKEKKNDRLVFAVL